MRIKYKGPDQLFFRRFWFVKEWSRHVDGSVWAVSHLGRKLFLPPGLTVVLVGFKPAILG